MHCRGASEHACPRYIARRRLDFAENSTAGIVGIPRVGASTDHSNYASALCCKRELLTRCSSPAMDFGSLQTESRTESRSCIRSRRFDSLRRETQRIDYRISDAYSDSQAIPREISRTTFHLNSAHVNFYRCANLRPTNLVSERRFSGMV